MQLHITIIVKSEIIKLANDCQSKSKWLNNATNIESNFNMNVDERTEKKK